MCINYYPLTMWLKQAAQEVDCLAVIQVNGWMMKFVHRQDGFYGKSGWFFLRNLHTAGMMCID